MKTFALLFALLAACGSKASPPSTTPPPPPAGGAETPAPIADTPAPPADQPGPRADKAPPADKPAPPAADPKADALAAETAAYEKAKPVFEKYCAGCHSTAGKKSSKKKLGHFNMDAYPFGGEHAAFIGNHIADVLGLTGKKVAMPPGKPYVTGDDLALVKAWVDAWSAAEKAGAHPAHGEDPDKD